MVNQQRSRAPRAARLLPLLLLLTAGCPSRPPPPVVDAGPPKPFEFAEVELSDPKFRIDEEGVCWFEVHYKFVKGDVGEHYMLVVNFPGTENACLKQIAGWQLPQLEGVIKDGYPLIQKPITDYEIVLQEAESPMDGYKTISNVLQGIAIRD